MAWPAGPVTYPQEDQLQVPLVWGTSIGGSNPDPPPTTGILWPKG